MDDIFRKIVEYFASFQALISAFLGAIFTFYLMKKTKRKEWVAEVNKQLIQKRLEAYEEIIEATKGLALGVGETIDGVWGIYPLALSDALYFSEQTLRYRLASTQHTHLIDQQLSINLTVFNNYLVSLDECLGFSERGHTNHIDPENLKRIGILLYPDFKSLTDDIFRTAGEFFSKTIYNESFVPAALTHGKIFLMCGVFNEFSLVKNRDKIHLLAKRKDEEATKEVLGSRE